MQHDSPTRADTDVVGSRAVAQLVDILVIVVVTFVVAVLVGSFALESADGTLTESGLDLIVFLLLALVSLGYGFALEAFWGGQTLGKRLMGIKVVMGSGRDVTTGAAFLRNVPALISPGWFAYLVALFSMATSDKRKRVFDRVANTVVVRGSPGSDGKPVGGIHERDR